MYRTLTKIVPPSWAFFVFNVYFPKAYIMKFKQSGEFEKQVLTAGQCVLLFMTVFAVFGFSVLVLCFEIGHKTWYNSKSKAKKVQSKKGNNGSLHDNYL